MWFIAKEVAAEMRRAVERGLLPTAEQRAAHERKELLAAAGTLPRNMSVAADMAEIRVDGVLTPKPDLFAIFFGGGNTTYRDLQASFAAAQSDPAIRRVELSIDSPGGYLDGLFETLAALESLKASGKKVSVRASRAQSAAYAIAAVAGKIRAETPASLFGSVGVVRSYMLDDDVVDIVNTDSPNKRPDLKTEAGKDAARREVDALFDVFVDAIARGRGVSVATVNKDFGQGSSFVAAEAARLGMIDKAPRLNVARAEEEQLPPDAAPSVDVTKLMAGYEMMVAQGLINRARPRTDASADVGGAADKDHNPMNLEQLKAQHPDLYAAVLSEGEKLGVAKERKRVSAHLKLADATGAQKVARAAIASGASTMDEEVHAEYLAAGMNRRDSDARQADSDAAAKAVDGAAAKPDADAGKKDLVDIFAADLPPVKKAS